MSVKSVIEIDVNDDKFKAFQAAFDRYQKVLDQQAKKWEEVSKTFDKINKKTKEVNKSLSDNNKHLKDAAYTTANIARNMASAALSAAKWLTFGAIGGGFGLGGLASSASDYRRQALGLGISTGQLRGANVAYGRAFNPESVLANIANIQNDPANKQILARLGGQTGQNPADQLSTVYKNAVQQFKQFGQNPQFAEALGLTKIFSLEDLRRGANMTAKELDDLAAQFKKDQDLFKLDDNVSKAWQDFWYELKKAGNTIELAFIKNLKDVVPQLVKLSETITTTISNLLASKDFQRAVKDFADSISSGEFQEKVAKFFNALGQLAEGMIYILRKVGALPGDKNADLAHDKRVQFGFAAQSYGSMSETQKKWFADPSKELQLLDLEEKYGLPTGVLSSVWDAESSKGKNKGKSEKGAEGDFQFIPKTAEEFGITDIQDFKQSADAAARKIKGLLRYYKNDPEKALAAYNWGEGRLDADIKEHGAEWKNHLRPETTGYLAKNQGVIVQINNNTGGNAVATAQALPAGRN